MPVTIQHRRASQLFGPDCVFGIVDWKGFLGNLDGNYATVTGTLEEVATPFGTGIQVAAANSYVQFDWTSLAPLLNNERSVFAKFYLPNVGALYGLAGWGANPNNNASFVYNDSGQYGAGLANDADAGGSLSAGWFTIGWSNAGINGGANMVYGQGIPEANGTNAVAAITTYTAFRIFNFAHANFPCPVGTIAQEVLVFNRVLSAAEILQLHNKGIGAA